MTDYYLLLILFLGSVIVLTALVYGGKIVYDKYYNNEDPDLNADDLNASGNKINDSKNRLISNDNNV